jgi:hypothetical protein
MDGVHFQDCEHTYWRSDWFAVDVFPGAEFLVGTFGNYDFRGDLHATNQRPWQLASRAHYCRHSNDPERVGGVTKRGNSRGDRSNGRSSNRERRGVAHHTLCQFYRGQVPAAEQTSRLAAQGCLGIDPCKHSSCGDYR